MSETDNADSVVIHDSANRRRFIRKGAVFVAAASVLAASAGRSALASDCDRGGAAGEKKPEHAGNGSDSDTGANADPTGCGRNYEDKPKISRKSPVSEPGSPRKISVAKIIG
ncbi:MAG: hypothetical protein AB8B87_07280 [Granulosicoccus sp.]